MITTFSLKPEEFTIDLFRQIKAMFANHKQLEIEIRSDENIFLEEETPEEYKQRIMQAISNLENNRNVKSFTETEFNTFVQELDK